MRLLAAEQEKNLSSLVVPEGRVFPAHLVADLLRSGAVRSTNRASQEVAARGADDRAQWISTFFPPPWQAGAIRNGCPEILPCRELSFCVRISVSYVKNGGDLPPIGRGCGPPRADGNAGDVFLPP